MKSELADLSDRGGDERLAEVLHAKMEHLDPIGGPPWSCLNDHDREFYRACVEAVLAEAARLCRPPQGWIDEVKEQSGMLTKRADDGALLQRIDQAYKMREAADHLRAYVYHLQRFGSVSEDTARHIGELSLELRRMAKEVKPCPNRTR